MATTKNRIEEANAGMIKSQKPDVHTLEGGVHILYCLQKEDIPVSTADLILFAGQSNMAGRG